MIGMIEIVILYILIGCIIGLMTWILDMNIWTCVIKLSSI